MKKSPIPQYMYRKPPCPPPHCIGRVLFTKVEKALVGHLTSREVWLRSEVNSPRYLESEKPISANENSIHCFMYRVFSLTWPAVMQIYWNKRKRLHKKRVQLPEDWFGTPTWPPFYCLGHQYGRRDVM